MGTEEKVEFEQPRMQIVKPTTEGKVIKVVDGKSSIEPNKSVKGQASDRKSMTTGSRKKV